MYLNSNKNAIFSIGLFKKSDGLIINRVDLSNVRPYLYSFKKKNDELRSIMILKLLPVVQNVLSASVVKHYSIMNMRSIMNVDMAGN